MNRHYPLICVEGLDSAGKATHTRRLVSEYESRGKRATRFEFPFYESPTGQLIRQHLTREWTTVRPKVSGFPVMGSYNEPDTCLDEMVFQSLMTVNRFESISKIKEALEHGPVILDRYWPSGFAYGAANGLDRSWLRKIHTLLPEPDLAIFLDIDPSSSWVRRPERRDRYESQKGLLEKVRVEYRSLFEEMSSNGKPWFIIEVPEKATVDDVHFNITHIMSAKGNLF